MITKAALRRKLHAILPDESTWGKGHAWANYLGELAYPEEATRRCILGAIHDVCPEIGDRHRAIKWVQDVIKKKWDKLSSWNDAEETTFEDIKTTIDRL